MTTVALPDRRPSHEDMLLHFEVEQFLTHEARLLDLRRFDEWYELLAEDLEYWMPVRTSRALNDKNSEFANIGESAFFDETKPLIAKRIAKLKTGFSWSEDPPSRTRHVFTNLAVLDRRGAEIDTSCNFLIYRHRLGLEHDFWCGRRDDTVRLTDAGWRLVKRHLFLDQVSLKANNVSIFF